MIYSRLATIFDTEKLSICCRETFYDTYYLQNTEVDMQLYMQTYFNDEAVKAEIEDAANTFILLLDEEVIIGYTKLTESATPIGFDRTDCLQISRIYVRKQYIGNGLGKQLMALCIDFAKRKLKNIIWLGVWEQNLRAINFYQQCGFEKFSEEIFVLGTDAQTDWLMKKQL